MASKPTPDPSILIPTYLKAEVSRLLNSKGEFLSGRKRSSAAAAELATLYKQLEIAWDELTSEPSRQKLERLRQRARSILEDLKRNEASVTNALELQSASELRNEESRLQRRRETLQKRKKHLAEQNASWPSEEAQLRNKYAADLRDLRAKSAERQTQSREKLTLAWKQLESNEPGAGPSLTALAAKQQQLAAQQLVLTEKQQHLSQKQAAIETAKQRIAEDLSAQQQTSADSRKLLLTLQNSLLDYEALKARLAQQNLIDPSDFPTFIIPHY